ncbi:MAG: RND family transporter [Myxococcota bacterium]
MTWILERAIAALGARTAALTRTCLRQRGLVFVVSALLCAWLGAGVAQLHNVASIRGFVPETDPELRRFDAFLADFPSDSDSLVVVSCAGASCRSILEPAFVRRLRTLEEELWKIDGIEGVTGLWSTPILRSEGDSLRISTLDEETARDPVAVRAFGVQLLREPLAADALLSRDLQTTAIVVKATMPDWKSASGTQFRKLLNDLRTVADRFSEDTGAIVFIAGPIVATEISIENTQADLRLLGPLMFGVMLVAFFAIYRSVAFTLAPILVVGIATLATFGAMGHWGAPITTVSGVLPTLIVIIGVTDSIHLLNRYSRHLDSEGIEGALARAARDLGVPALVTSLTSAAGLAAFALGPMPRLREFGLFAALGVMAAFLATFTLLPVWIATFQTRRRPRKARTTSDIILTHSRRLSLRHPALVLASTACVVLVSVIGIRQLRIQNELLQLLDRSDYVYRSETFIRSHLRPTRTLELLFEAPDGTTLSDPRALRELAGVEQLLAAQEQVKRVDSVLPLVRRAGQLTGVPLDPETRLPEVPGETDELLFLIEGAAPRLLRSYLTLDHRLVRMSAGFLYSDTKSDLETIRRIQAQLPTLAPHWSASLTGTTAISVRLSELVLQTQLSSLTGAMLAILVILALLVGSLRLGLLGMVPNLVPIIAILGLMGFWGIRLDIGTAMVGSVLIGIAVDDTVYFLLHYRNARRRGLSLDEAVAHTFDFSGRAAIFTSVVLAGGFLLLTFSRFQTLAYFGMLCSLAILAALVCDLLILPALLALGERVRLRAGARVESRSVR